MKDTKDKPAKMRCISVAEEAKRYFATVMEDGSIKGASCRKLCKTGCLLGIIEACIEHEEGEGEMLVISASEMAQFLRDAMEIKGKR